MLLAIDTSTNMAGLALVESGRLIIEMTWYCDQNHTIQLLSNMSILLRQASLNIKNISAIAVAKGPGSFNGLRVGVSTAKGLAFGLGVPIIGISTLAIEAYQFAACEIPVCSIHNAGRNEIAVAHFKKTREGWQQIIEEQITTLEELLPSIQEKTLFCGEHVFQIANKITQQLGFIAIIPPYSTLPRRGFFLAELGQAKIDTGITDNPATLQPLYLRRPPITERKNR